MNILFFDGVCPKPYTSQSLKTEPMGGTEATVIRVARGLARMRGITNVSVRTHHEATPETPGLDGVDWGHISRHTGQPDHMVCLREPGYLKDLRDTYPNAKLWLWLHDLPSQRLVDYALTMTNVNAEMIAVSDWQASGIQDLFNSRDIGVRIRHIYNPIDDALKPAGVPHNPYKLVFMSSPHKGLDRTLEVFQALRAKEPRFELHIANPGYFPDKQIDLQGVINHGPLPHATLMRLVSDALATLHCNTVFPETFGIVHAESNALGVPFLTDPKNGAVLEILDHPQEVIDVSDTDAVIARLLDWSNGKRPRVRGGAMFRLSRVLDSWYDLFRGTR